MLHAQDAGQPGFGMMVTGPVQEVGTLVRQTIMSAEDEVQYEISKILKTAMWFGLACITALVGLFVTALIIALVLFEDTGWPAWICALIIVIMLFGVAWGSQWRDIE